MTIIVARYMGKVDTYMKLVMTVSTLVITMCVT